MTAETN
jgi:hypothetical protein